MIWPLLAIAALVGWLVLERMNEVCLLSWRNGEMRLVRGSVPARLRMDITDALRSMKIGSTRVRIAKTERGARITASGLDDFHEQRLRNILQLFPLAQLRSGTAPTQNRLLRFFGFASLMWIFGSRDSDD
ncbi:MAG: DUF3634 family protein [Archangium sp.]